MRLIIFFCCLMTASLYSFARASENESSAKIEADRTSYEVFEENFRKSVEKIATAQDLQVTESGDLKIRGSELSSFVIATSKFFEEAGDRLVSFFEESSNYIKSLFMTSDILNVTPRAEMLMAFHEMNM